jgi:threonine dehydrogenase-like Zn-dependent dehydrogenase
VHALDWLADGTIDVEDMISHRMPLSMLDDALQLVENRESIKILLYPS